MNKKLVFEKGYTLEVTSWENDGDNYRTKSHHMETKEEAEEVRKMCKEIFIGCHNGENGIGNLMEDEYSQGEYIILDYLTRNQKLIKINGLNTIKSMKKDILTEFSNDGITEENYKEYAGDYYEENKAAFEGWIDMARKYNYSLMGGSEYYYSRVFESSTLYHSPEDIYLKIIL